MTQDLTPSPEGTFSEIAQLIEVKRTRAVRAVNTELIDLYWEIGKILSHKIEYEQWGKKVVDELAAYLKQNHPALSGFSRANLMRMRQFHNTYRDFPKVAPLVRQLSWSHNLLIISQAKRPEEREFYLITAAEENWTRRELERQLKGALFERKTLEKPIVSPAVRQLHPAANSVFKDRYVMEFLDLAEGHSEADLHQSLLKNLRQFLTELGRDFCFIGSEHPIQVGNQDFALDLLFFHRELNCLVAIELKVGRFEPEHLGKLNFYLEALDRDIKKAHENPSIGLLLCASKDNEVVEYALSRSLSPALIAQYETKLPNKKILQDKLHEFLELSGNSEEHLQSLSQNEDDLSS